MTWDAKAYDERFSYVTTYGAALLDQLDPKPGELILDVGCGTGHLTAEIAARGADAQGMDADRQMIERARIEHPGIEFRLGDARDFTVPRPVHAVFSNATLHWIPVADQPRTLRSVHDALRVGGRFVAEMGGSGNVRTILDALDDARRGLGFEALTAPAWCFPGPAEQAARLEDAGFRVRSLEHFDRPSALSPGDTAADWMRMFGAHLMADVPGEQRADLLAAVDRATAQELRGPDGTWHVDYVRLRWYATR
jgi:trans-aconitate methyltransferase